MASLRRCLWAALIFVGSTLQDSKNPLNDFCRRWGHQTAQVDGKLYIDGGLVAWNSLSSNPLNYTNTWLLYSDLNSTTQGSGMPLQYANLTKNNTVPSVIGGILWSDEVNKCFYLWGGEEQYSPVQGSGIWAYDTILNQWNETHYTSNVDSIDRVSFGAGTQIEELGLGFFYGGYMNRHTSPVWNGDPIATSNLIRYEFSTGRLTNNTGPDSTGRAEGSIFYLPASDGGLLVYFGGLEDPYRNGTLIEANMSTMHLYDVSSSKWYSQTAVGTIPPSRRQFCAGVTWADDHSSYNIYVYGGFGPDRNNVIGYDDAYILSLPSFTWIRAWPENNGTTAFGHGGCSANVISRDQMLIIGGWFPDTDQCDAANTWGQHNMNLGFNGPAGALWDKYVPNLGTYLVPTPVIEAVGGGPAGGAIATKPSSWDNPDLAVYFTRVPSFSARAETRTIPTGTANPSSTGTSKTNVGAIAGGVVGGLVGLIALLSLVLFCLHRRKKAAKNKGEETTTTLPPVELAATTPLHEMHSPGVTKYTSMQQSDANPHPDYSGMTSTHTHSPSDQHSQPSPYPAQVYQRSDPTSITPYPLPYGIEPPDHQNYQYNQYPQYSDNPSTYNTQSSTHDPHTYPQPTAPYHLRQYSYSPPILPAHHPLPLQLQPQVYYPPPPEPSTHSHLEGLKNSVTTDTQIPPSTTSTPAQFYARPVQLQPGLSHYVNGDVGSNPDGGYSGEAGSMRSLDVEGDGQRGSVGSR